MEAKDKLDTNRATTIAQMKMNIVGLTKEEAMQQRKQK